MKIYINCNSNLLKVMIYVSIISNLLKVIIYVTLISNLLNDVLRHSYLQPLVGWAISTLQMGGIELKT